MLNRVRFICCNSLREKHAATAPAMWAVIADMVFISVNTPTKTKGLGAGQASDLK